MSDAVEAGQAARRGGGLRVLVLAAAVVLLAAGVGMTFAAPFLFRAGAIDLATAMVSLQQWAMWSALAAAALGLVGLVLAFVGHKHRAGIVAVLVTAAGGMAAGQLYAGRLSRDDLPPIHDVQTDWSLPVAFTEAMLKQRAEAGAVKVRDDAVVGEGEGKWSGTPFAKAQAEFYDDIAPLKIPVAPAEATRAAAKAVERIGGAVTVSEVDAGVVEGVFHTPWYELAHDIAVRVLPDGNGSRVDVRATSRMPGADMGANASLVKQVLDEIVLVSSSGP